MFQRGSWRNYEATIRSLIDKLRSVKNQLNLIKIEPKTKINGVSGTIWEIDGIGYDADDNLVPIECKLRSKYKISQSILASFAYIIKDIGATRGIIVTPIGLQKGAKKIAEHENIEVITLNQNATSNEFDLVLPDRRQHHLGLHAVGRLEDEVHLVNLSNNTE
jgi:RecB family endonuclease NucS